MKGRGIDSEYLLTSLFNINYFHYYSKPSILKAYFFPLIAYGEGEYRPYKPEEFKKKEANIKAGKHGRNYATQGFGRTPLYEQEISYDYFYNKLCAYDQNKESYFAPRGNCILESDETKQDLRYILEKEPLYLMHNKDVSKDVKDTLLYELDSSEVKVILAKLLYYIISEDHKLPDVTAEHSKAIESGLNIPFHIMPNANICIGNRRNLDEDLTGISNRIRQAKEIQICCFDGVSLFGDKEITPVIQQNIIDTLHECADKNPDFNFEMILSDYRHDSFESAAQFQVNIPHLRCEKNSLPSKTLSRIKELTSSIPSDKFAVKLTKLPLPYAMLIMKFDNELFDHVKVDMYSPMIDDNKQRPSFYVFKRADPVLFEHFVSTFDKMWRSDEYSYFTERDNDSEE